LRPAEHDYLQPWISRRLPKLELAYGQYMRVHENQGAFTVFALPEFGIEAAVDGLLCRLECSQPGHAVWIVAEDFAALFARFRSGGYVRYVSSRHNIKKQV
jgi:hypothetical protein